MLLPAPFDIFIERGITFGPLVITVYDDLPPLPTVDDLAVVTAGTTGATSWGYQVVARNRTTGQFSAATATQGVLDGNATLDSTNYNRISWDEVVGANVYDIYRVLSGGTPNTTGLIRTVSGLNFNDVGVAADGSVPPTTGGPGVVVDLTGFTAHAQARRIPDDTVLQDLQPSVTDEAAGEVTIPKFRDEETLDFSLCTNGRWSLVLENSVGDWLPPIVAGAYTVVNSVTRDAA